MRAQWRTSCTSIAISWQASVPDAAPQDLFWSFQLTSGAYTLILSRTGRVDRLSDNLNASTILKRFKIGL